MKLKYFNFISNSFSPNPQATQLEVLNPATEEVIATLDMATTKDADKVLEAAYLAQKKWKKLTSIERGTYLLNLADKLVEHSSNIGKMLALESGKSVQDAIDETVYAAELTRYHAGWARRIEGELIPSDTPNENLILFREPIGVVVCLIPFNYPVYTLIRKITPALITGNTVIVRPSNSTPCSAMEIAKAVKDAGFPEGVINILVMDNDLARYICEDKRVGMITLTGSTLVGRQILEYSKAHIAKSSLELGGKAPAIVEPDTDLNKAAQLIVQSRTTHCGQLCTAVERAYVHESVYDKFVGLLKENMSKRSFGDRSINPNFMGPLVSEKARDKIHQKVKKAIEEKGKLVIGGEIPKGKGFYYPPTLIIDCTQSMEIIREEIFGPVLPVVKYKNIDQALEMANDHQYGLTSILFTENYHTIMRFSNEIEAGELYINRTPADPYQGFHAGWKHSGLGGDDGKHGMLEFTQTRLVIMNY